MNVSLKIAIVEHSPARAAIVEDGLRAGGYVNFAQIDDTRNLLARIAELGPDVILIDLACPSRDLLDQMFQVSRAIQRPIAIFVDEADTAAIQASVDAGVSAFIVDGLKKERMPHIVDLCISRFNAFSRLQRELEQTRGALAERKAIDRAKGILMTAKNLSEETAYTLLRQTAMNEHRKIAEVAQSVITAAEMFK